TYSWPSPSALGFRAAPGKEERMARSVIRFARAGGAPDGGVAPFPRLVSRPIVGVCPSIQRGFGGRRLSVFHSLGNLGLSRLRQNPRISKRRQDRPAIVCSCDLCSPDGRRR